MRRQDFLSGKQLSSATAYLRLLAFSLSLGAFGSGARGSAGDGGGRAVGRGVEQVTRARAEVNSTYDPRSGDTVEVDRGAFQLLELARTGVMFRDARQTTAAEGLERATALKPGSGRLDISIVVARGGARGSRPLGFSH